MAFSILDKKDKIQSVINVFETGSIEGDYSEVSIFNDGPNDVRQITYGRSQTTEYGNLDDLIKAYVENKGEYSDFFKDYVDKIGKTSLVNDKEFISKLKLSGKDEIMKKTQDAFFDSHYWNPAFGFLTDNEFTLPLSGLVIYDSYIHSGSVPMFLRNRFSEKTPKNGGDEKKWIEEYLETRNDWLANHSREILRKTTYRTKNMLTAVKNGNWDLEEPFIANGVTVP